MNLYRPQRSFVSANFTAVHGEGTCALLQIDRSSVFCSAIYVAANFTACYKRCMGCTAVSHNKDRSAISGRFVVVYFSANGQLAAAAKINNRGCALIVMYETIGLYFSCRTIVQTNGNRFAQLADFTVHVQLAVSHINSIQIRKIVNL